jgi:Zn-dependent protease
LIGDPQTFIVSTIFLIPAILIAIPVHELSHAYAAILQGDSTPRRQGYLRFNWRNWFEPYGVLAAVLARVGWGNPAPVSEHRLRGAGGKVAWALAGPVGNLVVAAVFGLVTRQLYPATGGFDASTFVQPNPLADLTYLCYAIFFLNLATCVFQLIPIPGLDGWHVLEALFRGRWPRFFFDASVRRREIWMIAVLVIFVGTFIVRLNLLAVVMSPVYTPLSGLIIGGCASYPGLSPCLQG